MRRLRSDSVEAEHLAYVNRFLTGPSPVPRSIHLRPVDRVYWDLLTTSDARPGWSEHHLLLAGQCARVMADMDEQEAALDAEDMVVVDANGRRRINPRVGLLVKLQATELRLLRALRIIGWNVGRRVHAPKIPASAHGLINTGE